MGLFFFYVARQGGCALGWFVAPGGRFGQCEGKKAVLSPKLGRVRTEEGEIIVFEPEVESGSDREKGNGRC
ncbi:hypothetical protein VL14_13145 [Cytobacillus firmus]|nr:hypothetical protein VL14_13145 [Cytobacillus firmus]